MKTTPHDPDCEECGRPRSTHAFVPPHFLECVDGGPRAEFVRAEADKPRLAVAPHPDVPLGSYARFDGARAEVVGGAYAGETPGVTDAVLVLYQDVAHGYLAVASIDDFAAREVQVHAGLRVRLWAPLGEEAARV